MKFLTICTLIVIIHGKPIKLNITDILECKEYGACHPVDSNKLNIHIVPHSHDDVGWLQTVDGYFSSSVESIIGSTIGGLNQNSQRRFIQVETAFFKMWLAKQPDYTIDIVKKLLEEGRLEITGGAWSMNDEAASHYQSTIDQFTLGFRYLVDTLGKCARPRVGWQIDPFGHSREMASIFAQLGFDAFVMGRIDYRDKERRETNKSLDLLWTGSANLGSESNIFASTLNHHYSVPKGFCWDKGCSDPIIVTDPNSDLYNWEERVQLFVEIIKTFKDHYPTNNILIPFGDDFQWTWAEKYFINIDRLIEGFEKFKPTIDGKELNVIYSTPSCYVKAVNEFVIKNNIALEVKTDDFFPYADGPNTVWSGYFSSRASSKRFERIGNNLNQVTKQLSAIAGFPYAKNVFLEEAMGVMQHHDAVTGTEKQAVEKDYHKSLYIGIEKAIDSNNEALSQILGMDNLNLKYCPLNNVSICVETENIDETQVLIYNPLARIVTQFVQIPVTGNQWKVQDPIGNVVTSLITKPIRDFSYIINDIGGNLHDNILIFKAENLPALGYKVFKIYKDNTIVNQNPSFQPFKYVEEDTKFGFDDQYIIINEDNGLVKSIKLNGVEIDVKIELLYYFSPESGAYIFRPDTDQRKAQRLTEKPENYVLTTDGDIKEFKQVFKDWATFIIRIYKDSNFIEVDWTVGPIDVGDNKAKDIILRYSTTLNTENLFYTDSNGRELLERKLNYRPTYEYTTEEPQAGNYYPVNTRFSIKDSEKQFSVITDRSQGGASLDNGWVELMVHRGLLSDDGRGVGENLYEIEYNTGLVVRGSHFITMGLETGNGEYNSTNALERLLVQQVNLAPWVFYTKEQIDDKEKSFLKSELPKNVNLLTLSTWNETENTLLLRLEHIMEKNEDVDLSKEITIDLTDTFTTIKIISLTEYTLGANIGISDLSRLNWPQIQNKEEGVLNIKNRRLRSGTDLKVTLAPMQIRTFIATIERQ